MSYQTAFVTGASVGIGRAIAITLADQGYRLVLLARREDRLQELQKAIGDDRVHIIACDINDQASLTVQMGEIPDAFSDIDVLVNNAGLALGLETADKAEWSDWQTMIETNCLSLTFLTRQILPGMVERNRGHIINIGSVAGSYPYRGGNVYGATKAFVDQFSINLKTELLGTKVRVTNIMPGLLGNTEFSLVRFHGDQNAADAVYEGFQPLEPEDIADATRWVLSQPEHVNVTRLEVMPTCQAPAGFALSKD